MCLYIASIACALLLPTNVGPYSPAEKATASRNINEYLDGLFGEVRAVKKAVHDATTQANKRRRSEAVAATNVDPDTVKRLKVELAAVREAATKACSPGVKSVTVEIRRTTTLGSRGTKHSFTMPVGRITIDRDNASDVLLDTRRALKRASRRRAPPAELLARHKRERGAYRRAEALAEETQRLAVRASRHIRRVADDPDQLRAEMDRWEQAVHESAQKVYSALDGLSARRSGVARVSTPKRRQCTPGPRRR